MADPSLNRTQVHKQFDPLNVRSRGAVRATHKPLLVLLALGNSGRTSSAPIAFSEVDVESTGRKAFDPGRKSYHPEFPFWWLHNDGVSTIEDADRLKREAGSGKCESQPIDARRPSEQSRWNQLVT